MWNSIQETIPLHKRNPLFIDHVKTRECWEWPYLSTIARRYFCDKQRAIARYTHDHQLLFDLTSTESKVPWPTNTTRIGHILTGQCGYSAKDQPYCSSLLQPPSLHFYCCCGFECAPCPISCPYLCLGPSLCHSSQKLVDVGTSTLKIWVH